MSEDDLGTQERILEATVKLLFAGHPEKLTTRRIAGEARVNVAAINYHFRSKDELLNRALEVATARSFEMGKAVLLAQGRDPVERLRDFLVGYAKGLVMFSGLTRAAFLGLFQGDDSKTFYGHYAREMLEKVAQVIAEARGPGAAPGTAAEARQDSLTTALMVLSCVIFPFLVTNTMRQAGAVDYTDDEARTRYIEETLARLVGVPPARSATTEEKGNG